MPKRASGEDRSGHVLTFRITDEELAKLDAMVQKMQQKHARATRASVLRSMLRRYLSKLDGIQP